MADPRCMWLHSHRVTTQCGLIESGADPNAMDNQA